MATSLGLLRERRQRLDLTLHEVVDAATAFDPRVRIDVPALSRAERSERRLSVPQLRAVARALQLDHLARLLTLIDSDSD